MHLNNPMQDISPNDRFYQEITKHLLYDIIELQRQMLELKSNLTLIKNIIHNPIIQNNNK